jgi:hypothetical protein
VFGCDTSLEQEVFIDLWTLFGTDVGLLGYVSYFGVPEARDIIGDVGVLASLRAMFRHRKRALEVIHRARAMRGKWRWGEQAAHMSRPLSEIRDELGIRVVGA